MRKLTKEDAAIYFQFAIMIVLALIVIFQVIMSAFNSSITVNEIVLGALVGSFMGLPQAFNTEKDDE